MSTSFFSHDSGSIAATVNSPSGGSSDFLDTKSNTCFILQNVLGTSGLMSKIFTDISHLSVHKTLFYPYDVNNLTKKKSSQSAVASLFKNGWATRRERLRLHSFLSNPVGAKVISVRLHHDVFMVLIKGR